MYADHHIIRTGVRQPFIDERDFFSDSPSTNIKDVDGNMTVGICRANCAKCIIFAESERSERPRFPHESWPNSKLSERFLCAIHYI